MRRILVAALALAIATPALAETQKQRDKRCDAQSQIVGQAVELRLKRRSEAKAKAAIIETVDAKLANSVPVLVGYIYTLPRQELKTDVKGAFIAQCKAYQP